MYPCTFREYVSELLVEVYDGLITERELLLKLVDAGAGNMPGVDQPEVELMGD